MTAKLAITVGGLNFGSRAIFLECTCHETVFFDSIEELSERDSSKNLREYAEIQSELFNFRLNWNQYKLYAARCHVN